MTNNIRTLRIGIASREKQKALMLAIARGEHVPSQDEPKVWFTSMESLAQVLSDRNKLLLEMIAHSKPASIAELAAMSGRERSNLWRTLRTMEKYGLVALRRADNNRRVEPKITYDKLRFEWELRMPAFC